MIQRFSLFFLFCLCFLLSFSQNAQREVIVYDLSQKLKGASYHNVEFTNQGIQVKNYNKVVGTIVTDPIKVPLENPQPFFTFTTVCENYQKGYFKNIPIAISWSVNGITWTPFIELEKDNEVDLGSNRDKSVLQFKENKYQFFKLRINVLSLPIGYARLLKGGCRASGGVFFLSKIFLHFYSPGNSTPQSPRLGQQPSLEKNANACPCPQPQYVNRTGWGCPDGQIPSCGNPQYSPVTHLIIHHSDGSNVSSNWATVVNAIWSDHINVNGWCDIGYNWLVDPNGIIYEGRGGGSNVIGSDFCSFESNTMGTCMLGNYMNTTPTPVSVEKLVALLAWKCCNSGIDPNGSSLHDSSGLLLDNISGHRNGCGTNCPGDSLYSMLPQIRDAVFDFIANNCTSVPPSNDNPCYSAELIVGNTCSFSVFSNSNATNSSIPPVMDSLLCDGPSYHDVWFKATVPPSGRIIIDTDPGTIDNLGIAIYKGADCHSLSYVNCYKEGSSNGPLMPFADLSGLVPGEDVWIRAWEFNNNNSGTFGICAWDPCPVLPESPTVEVIPSDICSGDSVSIFVTGGQPGTGGAWTWYQNGCGTGNPLGTGNSYSTTVNSTSTFFIRAEGDCGSSDCSEALVTVIPVPLANFSWNSNVLLVNFTDLSGDATDWIWNFGDGVFSNSQNPDHNFPTAGTYTVTLIVSNDCGSDTLTEEITVPLLNASSPEIFMIKVYPNPCNGNFFVDFPSEVVPMILQVADVSGKMIFEKTIIQASGKEFLEMNLSRGIYLLTASFEGSEIHFRLAVE